MLEMGEYDSRIRANSRATVFYHLGASGSCKDPGSVRNIILIYANIKQKFIV